MLNPSDVTNKKFEKYMGKGYRQDDVDGYLRQISNEIGLMLEDRQSLERKIEVLADKLMEYKNDEESMRAALIGAQKLGDAVIRESKDKASRIIEEANAKAASIVQEAQRSMDREQAAFTRLQHEVATFKSRLQLIYKQHLELISQLPAPAPTEEPVPVSQAAPAAVDPRQREKQYETTDREEISIADISTNERPYYGVQGVRIEDSQEFDPSEEYDEEDELARLEQEELDDTRVLEDDLPELEYEQEYEQEETAPVGKYESRFGPLKFGSKYDIKRDDEKRKK